ncbi:MAG: hypothetical protein AAF802_23570 [Planctomycetota bacterium]
MKNEDEPLLPQLSILQLIGCVTVCAFAMGVVQRAFSQPSTWSVLLSVAIFAIITPVAFWILTFCIANLLSAVGDSMTRERLVVEYEPTARMPESIENAASETPAESLELSDPSDEGPQ